MEPSELGRAALYYASLGYRVFPCSPNTKIPPAGSHGCLDATNNSEKIQEIWAKTPDANIGISTDEMLVLDVDIEEGDPPNPWLTAERSDEFNGVPCSKTPRGGQHFLFKGPGKNTASHIADHIDTRGRGGYFVAAPSVVDGKMYTWLRQPCRLAELEPAPQWLTEAMFSQNGHVKAPQPEQEDRVGSILAKSRNVTLTSLAGKLRRSGLSAKEILAALHQINADRCKPPLSKEEVEKIANSVARYDPVEEIGGEPKTWEELTKTPIVPIGSLVSLVDQEIEYLITDILPKGALVLLQGQPKGGKSVFSLFLAMEAALGEWLAGRFESKRPANVLLVEYEDAAILVVKRLAKYLRGVGRDWKDFPPTLFFSDYPELWVDSDKYADALILEIKTRKLDLVILDTLSHVHKAENENQASDMKPAMASLKRIAKQTGATILVIHHAAKGSSDRNIAERGRGSSVIAAAADVILDWGDRKKTNITPVSMASKFGESIDFSVEYIPMTDGSVEWRIVDVEDREVRKSWREELLSEIKKRTLIDPKGFPMNKMIDELPHISPDQIRRWVRNLESEGLVWSLTAPGKGKTIRFIDKSTM